MRVFFSVCLCGVCVCAFYFAYRRILPKVQLLGFLRICVRIRREHEFRYRKNRNISGRIRSRCLRRRIRRKSRLKGPRALRICFLRKALRIFRLRRRGKYVRRRGVFRGVRFLFALLFDFFGVDGNHAFACVSATETFSALSHIVPALRAFHAYEPLPEILIVSLFVIVSL